MAISNNDVRTMVKSYVDMFPEDERHIKPLLDLLADAVDVTTRDEVRGHITASAVVVNPFGLVLLVHHRASGQWIQPGGHPEPEDDTVAGAALRELTEETGIPPNQVELAAPEPIQIYGHTARVRYSDGGPAHRHFDCRFVVRSAAEVTRLQTSEVDASAWAVPEQLPNGALRDRLLTLT